MKTHISAFCTEFSEALFPLSQKLGDAVDQMEEVEKASDKEGITAAFSDIRHRLEALVNKVQGQEAYVLLFGPLKSGKSTLINAISSGYVSEVTSLPAYPCMVYLKYGETPKYSVFRYSGKREELDSPESLKHLLEQSHRTLSERIRAMDDFGEAFDPATHLPSAIRRVQVELPAENLKESGTVLVDTPGLYSKMKFGYDYMTREFRDSAASAVFVVKTDNLFLEQVFDDFNDLLDQFSRVFVVVNIDTNKSDLKPDGSLEPSLESRDPDQIVKAFEMLTMSAPLRRAEETGRLHIYPIDLRSAAARRLKASAAPAEPLVDPESADAEPDAFDTFMNDLLSYLNSVDYLGEFMADTIRQSSKLCGEIKSNCETHLLGEVKEEEDRQQKTMADVERKRASLNLLDALPLKERMEKTRETLQQERAETAAGQVNAFQQTAAPVIEGWLESDESLNSLKRQLQHALQDVCGHFLDADENRLKDCARSAHAGLALSASESEAFAVLGIDLPTLAGDAMPDGPVEPAEDIGADLEMEPFPVRKGFSDKLLFRSTDKLRRKLFKDADQDVPVKVKQRKLVEDADQAILSLAVSELEQRLARLTSDPCEKRVSEYVEAQCTKVEQVCTETDRLLNRMQSHAEQTLDKLKALRADFQKLAGEAEEVSGSIEALKEKHMPVLDQLKESGDAGSVSLPSPEK